MSRMGRGARAFAALLVLVAFLTGLPAALAVTIGNPLVVLPDVLAGDVTDAVLIALLASVAWVAWAQFALAVLAELVAVALRTSLPRGVPGVLGGQQQLARSLVSAVFLLGPLTASTLLTPAAFSTLPAASPVSSSVAVTVESGLAWPGPAAVSTPIAQTGTSAVADAEPTIEYTIPSGDGPATLWDIAATHLGSGERWQEIWRLNEGRAQPDGAVMSSPRRLLPGWTVLVPTSTTPAVRTGPADVPGDVEVTVEPGDTLSDLTLEHAQTADWQPAWQANTGRTQPDGSAYTDPDHLHPGWRLTIPATGVSDPAAPAPVQTAPAAPADPAPAGPAPAGPVASSAPAEQAGPDGMGMPTQRDRTAAEPAAPASTAVASPPAQREVAVPAGPADPAAPRTVGEADAGDGPSRVAAGMVGFGGGGVLLAASTWGTVLWLRRRRFRERTLGRTISATPPSLAPMEKALRVAAAAGAADVTWLDTALRSLGRPVDDSAPCAASLPDVVAVRMTTEVLELVLTAPNTGSAPAPWVVAEDGLRWSVRRDADLGVDFDRRHVADRYAPYPGLVTVGHTGSGEHYLIDLERIGALSLTGDRRRCLDLARFVAAELAHNRWSDSLAVDVVGFGQELAELNPSRVLHRTDADAAVAEARSRLRDTVTVLEHNGSDVLFDRVQPDGPGLGWPPHILLAGSAGDGGVAADPEAVQSLLDEMRAQRSRGAVAVVLVDDSRTESQTRWQVHVDADGQLTIPALGVELIAQQLPADEAADLAALLTLTAHSPDVAMPPGRGEQPWDAIADVAGAPLPAMVSDRVEPPSGLSLVTELTGPPDGGSVLPKGTGEYLAETATTAADVLALAPRVSGQVRRQVEEADPDLDADLAAWHDPHSRVAKLTVLGPAALIAHGVTPKPARPDFYVELAVYVTTRPAGATAAQVGEAIWAEPGPSARARTALSALRRWLGEHPVSGEGYLQAAGVAGGVHRWRGLLVDAELFRRLRLRGVARGAEGIVDLEAALELVTGVPLDAARRGARAKDGYAWLVDTPLEHEYVAMIIDVAHLVATHQLAAGRPERAERAAHAALRTGAQDDVALLDLVAAHDAAGNQAEADRYVARILTNHDAEIEEDLPPRTYEVLRRRSWLPTPTARTPAATS